MTFSLCKQTKCSVRRPAITRCRYKCCSSRTTRQTTRCDALEAKEWLKIINLEATGTTVVLKKDRQVVLSDAATLLGGKIPSEVGCQME